MADAGASSFTPAQQESLLGEYERAAAAAQRRAAARAYLDLAQAAFRQCAHSFTRAELTDKERKCVQAVARKQLAASMRVGARLAEAQGERAAAERETRERELRERGAAPAGSSGASSLAGAAAGATAGAGVGATQR